MIERSHRFGRLVFDRDAIVLAAGMLGTGEARKKGDVYVVYGEKLAGVGFWLCGDRVAGTLFDDPVDVGARQLAMWGLLQGGRLLPRLSLSSHPSNKAALAE